MLINDGSEKPEDESNYTKLFAILYPVVNEKETPIPKCWSSKDKFNFIGLSQNKLLVHYKGVGKTHKDAASIRTAFPIPASCGIYYFEVKIIDKGRDGYMGIGLSSQSVSMNRLPGWDKHSYGYHGDDGRSFCSSGTGQPYGPTFTTNDIIGCGVNYIDNNCFYTKNGIDLGVAFQDLPPNLYPTVGLQTLGETIETNFGQHPFIFDIFDKIREMRCKIHQKITEFNVTNDKHEWGSLMQKIVMNYLINQGYTETAKSFDKCTSSNLKNEIPSWAQGWEDVRNRQIIQTQILSGRIGKSIDMINNLYPLFFASNASSTKSQKSNFYKYSFNFKLLLFKLKCRQFIEIISGADDTIQNSINEQSILPQQDIFNRTTNSTTNNASLTSSRSNNVGSADMEKMVDKQRTNQFGSGGLSPFKSPANFNASSVNDNLNISAATTITKATKKKSSKKLHTSFGGGSGGGSHGKHMKKYSTRDVKKNKSSGECPCCCPCSCDEIDRQPPTRKPPPPSLSSKIDFETGTPIAITDYGLPVSSNGHKLTAGMITPLQHVNPSPHISSKSVTHKTPITADTNLFKSTASLVDESSLSDLDENCDCDCCTTRHSLCCGVGVGVTVPHVMTSSVPIPANGHQVGGNQNLYLGEVNTIPKPNTGSTILKTTTPSDSQSQILGSVIDMEPCLACQYETSHQYRHLSYTGTSGRKVRHDNNCQECFKYAQQHSDLGDFDCKECLIECPKCYEMEMKHYNNPSKGKSSIAYHSSSFGDDEYFHCSSNISEEEEFDQDNENNDCSMYSDFSENTSENGSSYSSQSADSSDEMDHNNVNHSILHYQSSEKMATNFDNSTNLISRNYPNKSHHDSDPRTIAAPYSRNSSLEKQQQQHHYPPKLRHSSYKDEKPPSEIYNATIERILDFGRQLHQLASDLKMEFEVVKMEDFSSYKDQSSSSKDKQTEKDPTTIGIKSFKTTSSCLNKGNSSSEPSNLLKLTLECEIDKDIQDAFSLLAYPDPWNSPVKEILDPCNREPLAQNINSAILLFQGETPYSTLDMICGQIQKSLKLMSQRNMGQCAFALLKDFL